jgi:hypothetical protein
MKNGIGKIEETKEKKYGKTSRIKAAQEGK